MSEPDLAADVLEAARRSARGTRAKPNTGRVRPPQDGPTMSGATVDDRDPRRIGTAVDDLIDARGWSARTAVAAVLARWDSIVGAELSAHVQAAHFEQQTATLSLVAESSAWATQVRLLLPELQRRLDCELGSGMVRSIDVSGPRAPSPRYGKLRVPGPGPRDTYG